MTKKELSPEAEAWLKRRLEKVRFCRNGHSLMEDCTVENRRGKFRLRCRECDRIKGRRKRKKKSKLTEAEYAVASEAGARAWREARYDMHKVCAKVREYLTGHDAGEFEAVTGWTMGELEESERHAAQPELR